MRKYLKGFYEILILGLIAIIVICGIRIYTYKESSATEVQEFEDLKSLIITTTPDKVSTPAPSVGTEVKPDPVPDESSETQPPKYEPNEEGEIVIGPGSVNTREVKDLSALKKLNSDIVGWISIPGTSIDYPVMQTNSKPDYYLRKNFYGRYSIAGTPYAEEGCDIASPGDNITIYGHNMNDKTMFQNLEGYKDESFYSEHKYINFDTFYYSATYEVVAVFKTAVYTGKKDEFKYWNFQTAQSEDEFNTFMENVRSRSLYDIDTEVSFGDKLITLSTCEYSQKDGRMAVVAKLISKTEF